MERNWLIRTSQNQILGPVAKSKLLEFIEKGALGLNDEVASGNGYWIALKEKDLVEKYLYGDVPQGYNPISESKSVLSQRENPDKTTSLNTAPPNKTQVLKQPTNESVALPSNDDLEYPDITLVKTSVPPVATASLEQAKLPDESDLEFPDITLIAPAPVKTNVTYAEPTTAHAVKEFPKTAPKAESFTSTDEPIFYPKDDDLDYPDIGNSPSAPVAAPISSTKTEQSSDEDLTFVVEKSNLKRDFKIDLDHIPSLSLDVSAPPPKEEKPAPEPVLSIAKKTEKKEVQHREVPHEEKKLLHERKVKASAQKEIKKEPEAPRPMPDRTMPEHLKKRNDNYLLYLLIIVVVIILALFFYYYRNILNKPLPV